MAGVMGSASCAGSPAAVSIELTDETPRAARSDVGGSMRLKAGGLVRLEVRALRGEVLVLLVVEKDLRAVRADLLEEADLYDGATFSEFAWALA